MQRLAFSCWMFLIGVCCCSGSLFAQTSNALNFDNTDDEVLIPNASARIAGSSQLSLSFWVYPTNAAPAFPDYDGFAGIRNNVDADFYIVQLTDSQVEARFRNSAGVNVDILYNGLLLNTWQHFVLVYNGAEFLLYHNGSLVGNTGATGTITNVAEALYIGNLLFGTYSYWMQGSIDEVSLWNRALTPAEVRCIYRSSVDVTAIGLQLYYQFDQGIAGGNNAGLTTLIDGMGNINGTLYNFALNGALSNWVEGADTRIPLSATLCRGGTYTFGTQTLDEPGVYTETFAGTSGCDSTVALTLSWAIDTSLQQSGPMLTANQAGVAYTWVDCQNGYTALPGEIAQSFIALADGFYAVVLDDGTCVDTSSCYEVLVSGLSTTLNGRAITLFPNPTSGTINLSTALPGAQLSVCDLQGRVVYSNVLEAEERCFDLTGVPAGSYQVVIVQKGERLRLPLVMQ